MSASRRGIDVPDGRGRVGLDQAGRDLSGNPRVKVTDVEVLANDWGVLRRTTFQYLRPDGSWATDRRETYDRGNGAAILLYEPDARTVVLVRQFRYPAYVNGHPDGMLLELPAGLLDADGPEEAVRREAEEETGYRVGDVQRVCAAVMSPGSVTETLHVYAAPYSPTDRVGEGGGIEDEGEDIEVVELAFDDALALVRDGTIVDAKTVLALQWAALDGPFRRP
ncbi:NUDIX domain-containing protein [Motilibacter aurantiacus]|uniref:NUDIX domain-containing protein n=1 Tax=Motilibacter aurantiacus TaxID=2714955 RepID=UPI00140AC309|nr:NUDIX domain-containing protein [Motilibacter aurantiacus]NHC47059.1 NUDIX domain-containing protein [Motilibacter aurantiacus]